VVFELQDSQSSNSDWVVRAPEATVGGTTDSGVLLQRQPDQAIRDGLVPLSIRDLRYGQSTIDKAHGQHQSKSTPTQFLEHLLSASFVMNDH
jgi:hypothetical protein